VNLGLVFYAFDSFFPTLSTSIKGKEIVVTEKCGSALLSSVFEETEMISEQSLKVYVSWY